MLKARNAAFLKFQMASLLFPKWMKGKRGLGQRKEENIRKPRKSTLQIKPQKMIYSDDTLHTKKKK